MPRELVSAVVPLPDLLSPGELWMEFRCAVTALPGTTDDPSPAANKDNYDGVESLEFPEQRAAPSMRLKFQQAGWQYEEQEYEAALQAMSHLAVTYVITGEVVPLAVLTGSPVTNIIRADAVLLGGLSVPRTFQGVIEAVAVLAGLARSGRVIDGAIVGTGVLLDAMPRGRPITGVVLSTAVVDVNWDAATSAQATIIATAALTGEMVVASVRDSLSTVPFVVYGFDVMTAADVTAQNVPESKPFLVSGSFAEEPGDPFYDAGARQSYIGVKVGSSFIWRAPEDKEVALYVSVDAAGTYSVQGFRRFEAKSTPVWHPYFPWPERQVMSAYVFDITDPDGFWRYVAQIASEMYEVWQNLNRGLTELFDTDAVPDDFLIFLADQIQARLSPDNSIAEQRKMLHELQHVPRVRGLERPVPIMFRHKALLGYVRQVWADPEDANNWYDPALAPGDVQAHMIAIGIYDRVLVESGQKGQQWVAVPHNYFQRVGEPFWPTARFTAHFSNLDGTPIPVSSLTADQLNELRDALVVALDEVLPPHADIRWFVETGNVGANTRKERLEVDDTLTLTAYAYIIPVQTVVTGFPRVDLTFPGLITAPDAVVGDFVRGRRIIGTITPVAVLAGSIVDAP